MQVDLGGLDAWPSDRIDGFADRLLGPCQSNMAGGGQRCSVHANVHNHFNLERHLVDRETCKERRSAASAERQVVMS
jgi:putative transposase